MISPIDRTLAKLVLTAVAALTWQTASVARADTWDLSDAITVGTEGAITIPGDSLRNLRIEDPEIQIVNDKQSKSGKALQFSGTQAKPLTASRIYDGDSSASLELKVKPASDAAEEAQTILVRPGVYELRYNLKRQVLDVMVTYKENTPVVVVTAPLPADDWSKIKMSIKGSKITVQVDDNTVTGELPAGATLRQTRSYLRIGRMDQSRAFKGMVTDISVSEPAE